MRLVVFKNDEVNSSLWLFKNSGAYSKQLYASSLYLQSLLGQKSDKETREFFQKLNNELPYLIKDNIARTYPRIMQGSISPSMRKPQKESDGNSTVLTNFDNLD